MRLGTYTALFYHFLHVPCSRINVPPQVVVAVHNCPPIFLRKRGNTTWVWFGSGFYTEDETSITINSCTYFTFSCRGRGSTGAFILRSTEANFWRAALETGPELQCPREIWCWYLQNCRQKNVAADVARSCSVTFGACSGPGKWTLKDLHPHSTSLLHVTRIC